MIGCLIGALILYAVGRNGCRLSYPFCQETAPIEPPNSKRKSLVTCREHSYRRSHQATRLCGY
jgi:hypothetical protein